MIPFTQLTVVLHKYLHDELRLYFVTIYPWGCTEFPEFPCSEKSLSIPWFPVLWPPWVSCRSCSWDLRLGRSFHAVFCSHILTVKLAITETTKSRWQAGQRTLLSEHAHTHMHRQPKNVVATHTLLSIITQLWGAFKKFIAWHRKAPSISIKFWQCTVPYFVIACNILILGYLFMRHCADAFPLPW